MSLEQAGHSGMANSNREISPAYPGTTARKASVGPSGAKKLTGLIARPNRHLDDKVLDVAIREMGLYAKRSRGKY